MNEEEFENEFVHKFYSRKSTPFSESRVKPWPYTLKFMLDFATDSSLILDSGCGNGRQFISQNTVGLDYSENLLNDAKGKVNLGLVRGTVHTLPFRDESFDIVLSIAVLHHLSTHRRRVQCLEETRRVMKKGAYGLIYAWHTTASKKSKFKQIEENEYFVSWRGETDALRYYFLFDENTLTSIAQEAKFTVLKSGIEQESVYVVVRK
ncbi:hypothetical protein PAEPH01_2319 [Pancytospora epiphaga]|nr:hypothetical protein PAEPH01_2319 [Pancytospora epiphaga]